MAFALGELKVQSLASVYAMPWAEFLLRAHAYERMETNSWRKVREIAYNSLIGPHADPKKIPNSANKYLPLDDQNAPEIDREEIKRHLLELHAEEKEQQN